VTYAPAAHSRFKHKSYQCTWTSEHRMPQSTWMDVQEHTLSDTQWVLWFEYYNNNFYVWFCNNNIAMTFRKKQPTLRLQQTGLCKQQAQLWILGIPEAVWSADSRMTTLIKHILVGLRARRCGFLWWNRVSEKYIIITCQTHGCCTYFPSSFKMLLHTPPAIPRFQICDRNI
jgi:hypothetical protein